MDEEKLAKAKTNSFTRVDCISVENRNMSNLELNLYNNVSLAVLETFAF